VQIPRYTLASTQNIDSPFYQENVRKEVIQNMNGAKQTCHGGKWCWPSPKMSSG